MKKLLVAGIAAAAFCSAPALAADLPVKAPVYRAAPAPMFSWTGFYVGGNIGGAWGGSHTSSTIDSAGGGYIPSVVTDINALSAQHVSSSAVTGGLQAGFNVQANNFVYGAEADFNSLNLKGSTSVSAVFTGFPVLPGQTAPTYTNSINTDWLFTARGRLGFTANNVLFYGTGGVAVTNLKYGHTFTEGTFNGSSGGVETSTVSANKVGYAVGGGLEYAWMNNWSVKVEYLYLNFGNVTSSAPVIGLPNTFSHSANLIENIVRVGLNYKFGDYGKAPVSAKY
jgi:outer membrane immunogenic protein